MESGLGILWLGPVFDETTLERFLAASPAATRWQTGLIRSLQESGVRVYIIGHLPEPLWPRGRLRIGSSEGALPPAMPGQLADYWNVPIWRNQSLCRSYRKMVLELDSLKIPVDVVVTYNASSATVVGATYARERYGVPWINVVADDEAPSGADGYVFLSWAYYQAFSERKPKLHLDGGVSEKRLSLMDPIYERKTGNKVVMYAGAMTRYAGVGFLVRAFHQIDDPQIELWICGKGSNAGVEKMAAVDRRIKLFGFVSEGKLSELMQQADVFVNPRPSYIKENDKNFPSKLLEYLSYGKPVISTWTPGLSPEYRDVIVVLEQESEENLAAVIQSVLNWDSELRQMATQKVARFLKSRLWKVQASKFLHWLEPILVSDG